MNEVLIQSEFNGCQSLFFPHGEYLLGRDGNVSIHVDDPSVSRYHARLKFGSDGTLEVLLPASEVSAKYEIEVHSVQWHTEHCFISQIHLVAAVD